MQNKQTFLEHLFACACAGFDLIYRILQSRCVHREKKKTGMLTSAPFLHDHHLSMITTTFTRSHTHSHEATE